MLTVVYLLLLLIDNGIGIYKIINTKPGNITFRYMDGVDGESTMHVCQRNEVCNIVHDRFWMPTLTERLCRCPDRKECPWQYKSDSNSSMTLNNRSVLKFCSSTVRMNICTPREMAVVVNGEGDTRNSYMVPRNVTVNCFCPRTHYWKLQKYVYDEDNLFQIFRCVKKRMCDSFDFCGHIRSDLYSAYYRCTCPQGHLCIFKEKMQENVQELLYSGPAYKAYCYPI